MCSEDAARMISDRGVVTDLDVLYPALGCEVRSQLATAIGADCTRQGNLDRLSALLLVARHQSQRAFCTGSGSSSRPGQRSASAVSVRASPMSPPAISATRGQCNTWQLFLGEASAPLSWPRFGF